MLASEKERAEHIMLVDLGRNDLGRVCEYGTVQVEKLMSVERYSHVMHLVSSLRGKLREDVDCFDALMSCFPAGTVSGAPKVRAMEIIEEFEKTRRGIYAGGILYLDFAGNLDSCIALRTMVIKNGVAHVQAGGGIVADSTPEGEFHESVNKSKALLRALEAAHGGGNSPEGKRQAVILLLDNYDSFTYNLAQYLGELGCQVEVHRNDRISVEQIARRKPERIVISPGPLHTAGSGHFRRIDSETGGKIPILGVCLGHQAMGAAFGGKIIRAPKLFHGKTSEIQHEGKGIFRKLPNPFTATRYHSLIVERKSLPAGTDGNGRDQRWDHHGTQPQALQAGGRAIPPGVRAYASG